VIYDCFSFFNELELLEIRLHELEDVVDCFVLIEATKTHSGLDKPLYFQMNKDLFTKWNIKHIVVDGVPTIPDRDKTWLQSDYQKEDTWVMERYQRNFITPAVWDADPMDIIIISDADEIVRKSVIEDIKENGMPVGSNAINQKLVSMYFNVVCTNMPWWGSKIVHRKMLDIATPSEVRFHTPAVRGIENGGWHFNWIGGGDKVKLKIRSYAHQEFNRGDVLNNVENQMRNLKDPLGRLYEMKYNTRFNPTVSGELHLGHLYIALVNAHEAHSSGGKFILRIDDSQDDWTMRLGKKRIKYLIREYIKQLGEFVQLDQIDLQSYLLKEKFPPTVSKVINKIQPVLRYGYNPDWSSHPEMVMYPYTPLFTAEKVYWDYEAGVNWLIRGDDLISEFSLYAHYMDLMGISQVLLRHTYIPRLRLPDNSELSKTNGGYSIREALEVLGKEEILKRLRDWCLVDPEKDFSVDNIKCQPTMDY